MSMLWEKVQWEGSWKAHSILSAKIKVTIKQESICEEEMILIISFIFNEPINYHFLLAINFSRSVVNQKSDHPFQHTRFAFVLNAPSSIVISIRHYCNLLAQYIWIFSLLLKVSYFFVFLFYLPFHNYKSLISLFLLYFILILEMNYRLSSEFYSFV